MKWRESVGIKKGIMSFSENETRKNQKRGVRTTKRDEWAS